LKLREGQRGPKGGTLRSETSSQRIESRAAGGQPKLPLIIVAPRNQVGKHAHAQRGLGLETGIGWGIKGVLVTRLLLSKHLSASGSCWICGNSDRTAGLGKRGSTCPVAFSEVASLTPEADAAAPVFATFAGGSEAPVALAAAGFEPAAGLSAASPPSVLACSRTRVSMVCEGATFFQQLLEGVASKKQHPS